MPSLTPSTHVPLLAGWLQGMRDVYTPFGALLQQRGNRRGAVAQRAAAHRNRRGSRSSRDGVQRGGNHRGEGGCGGGGRRRQVRMGCGSGARHAGAQRSERVGKDVA